MSRDVQGAVGRQVQLERRLESGWGGQASEQKVRASARPGGGGTVAFITCEGFKNKTKQNKKEKKTHFGGHLAKVTLNVFRVCYIHEQDCRSWNNSHTAGHANLNGRNFTTAPGE